MKTLIREGVQRTSVVFVLAGTHTWSRRWVRYEIARAVVDGKGLFAIHINGINHHERKAPDPRSDNPCYYMGIALRKGPDKYYLCERKNVNGAYKWEWYEDHTNAVPVPKFMPKAPVLTIRYGSVR